MIRLSPAAGLTITEAGVLLRSDLGTFALEGRDVQQFVSALAPLLADWREPDALAAALPAYSPASIGRFLALLQQRGLVETQEAAAPQHERWRGQEEFFRQWTEQPGPTPAMERLRAARVLVVGLEPWGVVAAAELAAGGVGALHLLGAGAVTSDDLLSVRQWGTGDLGRPRADALRDVLAAQAPWCSVTTGSLELDAAGLLQTPPANEGGREWGLLLAATSADDLRVLMAAARCAHALGLRSLYGALDGLEARIGPAVVPGETACWNCCRLRLLGNAAQPEAAHELQAALLAASPPPRARTYLAPTAALLGQGLALEAITVLTGYAPSALIGCLRTQNLVTLETERHRVIRMPWCDVCGGAASGGSGEPGGGAAGGPGGARSPEELRHRLAGWVDARTGIVRSLTLLPPQAGDPELPLVAAAVPARYTEGCFDPQAPEPSFGHGLSAVPALLGAVGEAIERYSAARFRPSDMRRARMTDLDGPALDPRLLCFYDEVQYDTPGFPFARFAPDRPIAWTEARWLDGGGPVWVPALPTFLGFPAPPEEYFCQVTSNGLAAGNGLEDAALRAVFELVERDAFLLTWLARHPGKRLMLDETVEPGVGEVIRRLEGRRSARVELYLLDVGLGIPTVACIAFGDGTDWPGATVALAAHADPRVALRKAVLEQGDVGPSIRRLWVGGKGSIPARPEDVRTLEDHALYYAPPDRARAFDFLREGSAAVPLAALPAPGVMGLDDCARRLSQAGIRVAISDVSSPDVATSPFRVARALGTHMQPIDFGFGLRRLGNPRLKALLTQGVNPDPHPLA